MFRGTRIVLVVLVLALFASVSFAQEAMTAGTTEQRGEQGAPSLSQWSPPSFWMGPSPAKAEGQRHPSTETPTIAAPTLYSFVAITPCRQANSLNTTPLLQGVNRAVVLTGSPCFIPASAAAVSANITVFNITGATGNGVFKVDTVSPPLSAWVNYPPTETQRANAGVLALNGSGQIIVQVAQGAGQVDFVVDINGYYTLPPITLAAFVQGSDGSLSSGLHATGASRVSTGQYEVDFDRVVATSCFWTGSAGNRGFFVVAVAGFVTLVQRSGNTSGLFVETRNAAGTLTDIDFGVNVICP